MAGADKSENSPAKSEAEDNSVCTVRSEMSVHNPFMLFFGGGRFAVRSIKAGCYGFRNLDIEVNFAPRRFFQTTSSKAVELANSPKPMEQHDAAVKAISATVRSFYDRKEKFRINHGSTNSTRPRNHKNVVDVGHLKNILNVDTQKKTVLVEPNVPMDRLAEGTMKYGLVPPVVMEFPGITVGGGYSGTSGESSSFKHGFFDRTINYVEMVLADGSVVKTSPTERPDLFNGAAGAMGTLGITTLVELQLLEAKKYVETTYHPVTSVQQALDVLETATNDVNNDYVDGILYSKTSGAIITGRMTDTPPSDAPIQTFSGSWDPWFYLHVKDIVDKSTPSKPIVEAIPLAEYLFRYDRGGFWVGASAFKFFHTPFNKFTRWFLDDFLHTRMMYTALHASGQSKKYVVQDLAIPYEKTIQFIDYTESKFAIWPLWLCPLKTPSYPSMHPHLQNSQSLLPPDQKMLNVGLWGFGPNDFEAFVDLNKDLERTLLDLGGVRWLYAHSYESEDEFWQTYDKKWYAALREKYGATGLPDVYEKVRIDVEKQRVQSRSWTDWLFHRTFVGGFWGIWKAIRSGTYLEARASSWKGRPDIKDGGK